MATTKMQAIKFLPACIAYCTKYSKTDFGKFITTHECHSMFVPSDFEAVNQLRRQKNSREWKVENRMIFQNFKPSEITPELAHDLGIKLAQQYLKNEHQYIVTTHIDKDHIHNHIVFNCTNFKTLKSFDSRKEHYVYDLRRISDNLCREYGLSVIENPKQKGIQRSEYYARKFNRSFKHKLANLIDKAITESKTWQDFIETMEQNCEIKYGAYIAFKQSDQTRFTRAKSLGIDYTEESIKYRIEHKDFEMVRMPNFPKLIDKSDERFQGKENDALRNWATKENIATLAEMGSTIFNNKLSKADLMDKVSDIKEKMSIMGKEIEILDNSISDYKYFLAAHDIYKKSASLFNGLKQSKDKVAYKNEHYVEFKEYDRAKAVLTKYKNKNGKVPSPESILNKIQELQLERGLKYLNYQDLKTEFGAMQYSSRLIGLDKQLSKVKEETL